MTEDEGNQLIPHDRPCRICGELTWRKELGARDRIWHDGFVCGPCWLNIRKPWVGLVSPDGKEEMNARFVLGDKRAESMKAGEIVDLSDRNGKTRKWRISHTL